MTLVVGCIILGSFSAFAAENSNPLESIQIVPPDPYLPEEIKFFSGYWEGTWMDTRMAYGGDTARLLVSEVSKEEVVVSTALNTRVTLNKIKAKIKRHEDGRLYIEFPPVPAGTIVYIAYPEKGELKAVAQSGAIVMEAILKKKER